MNPVFLVCFIFIFCYNVTAQNAKTITVKAGNDVKEFIANEMYRYPKFLIGKVFFRDGKSTSAKLNYNLLVGDMQYIDLNGDTLSIANSKEVGYIKIEEDSFFYDQGYIELLNDGSTVKLGIRQIIKLKDFKRIGAYGLPSHGTIESYGTYTGSHQVQKINVKEDLVFSKQTNYYFGDKFNHFIPATRKNVLQIFSNHQRKVEKFLYENDINFNKHQDLEKLIAFLQVL
ncbi:MAG: hypothetical protein WKF97_09495 [Chitinophagaceae bacterium]